jgi:Domain of unknown function (DUF4037)
MPDFVPAAELSRDFYAAVLAPALTGVPHAAGLLGAGSDVLGYDTERSTDHDWGPRATLFVAPEDVTTAQARVEAALPETFRGWPVQISKDDEPDHHRVVVDVWNRWLVAQLGVDATAPLGPVDWLLIPQQQLLHVVAGPVFADPGGQLADVRRRLAWYPDDVWWWLLAAQWRRIAQEEAFVQRTAEVGDQLGSAVLAARLVRDCLHLALLMARQYAPYPKWLGTAFARLPHPDGLDQQLAAALAAPDLARRERALSEAYQSLARRHGRLPGATALDPAVRRYFDRPAMVLGADRFAADCLERVTDPKLRALPLIGSIDQFADSSDLNGRPDLIQRVRRIYD